MSMETVRLSRRLAGAGLATVISLVLSATLATPAMAEGTILGTNNPGAIKDNYLVAYKDAVNVSIDAGPTARLAAKHNAKVTHTYRSAIRGFAATMSQADAKRLAADPAVAYVEQDQRISATDTQTPTPMWGVDRIDQRRLPGDFRFTYPTTASNVHAYIVDSGIRTTHTQFAGRATWGTNTTYDGIDTDCHGHGTHVAGTVGGTDYGVAKGARLVAVKVLGCNLSGTLSSSIAGIDWVTANAIRPAVVNVSYGHDGWDHFEEEAIRNSIASGLTYVIASGNGSKTACNYSPARVTEAITVNATMASAGAAPTDDIRAPFSNFGPCTDIFAPGYGIRSASNADDTSIVVKQGTSMAAPHATGVAALYLSANPAATQAQVADWMFTNATPNIVVDPGAGSPNRFLYLADPTAPALTNGIDTAIADLSTATSSITGSATPAVGSTIAKVEVHIKHTWRSDLIVDLLAPDGSVSNLHNRTGWAEQDIHQTYTIDLSSEAAGGTWRLRVQDVAPGDFGFIDSWTLDI